MTVSLAQAQAYTGDSSDAVTRALAVAQALVTSALVNAWRTVPDAVTDECVLRTTYAILRKGNANTSDMYAGAVPGQVAAPVANDPLRTSYDLIKRYTPRV